ncbi:UNVERIFIED_CONTAM: hypothetical protein Sradi_5291700 [Sesamum radiatum]|uniref:MADS-box domain-containing protein n=1 Tax=Sesamum radiatum TaxID=300843 RepID=A0AAW2LNG2_SESRA
MHMTRKRVKYEQISSERKRKVLCMKRVESLIKKANDLSILCGVNIGIVIHKPTENNAVLWPSPEVFGDRLQRFLDFSESEKAKKMVTHEKYLHQRVNDGIEEMSKSQYKKELKESQLVMTELSIQGKDFSAVDLVQLNCLQSFADQMLKKLKFKDDEVNEQEREMLITPPSPPSFTTTHLMVSNKDQT